MQDMRIKKISEYAKPRIESRKLRLIANMFGSVGLWYGPDFRQAPRRSDRQDGRD